MGDVGGRGGRLITPRWTITGWRGPSRGPDHGGGGEPSSLTAQAPVRPAERGVRGDAGAALRVRGRTAAAEADTLRESAGGGGRCSGASATTTWPPQPHWPRRSSALFAPLCAVYPWPICCADNGGRSARSRSARRGGEGERGREGEGEITLLQCERHSLPLSILQRRSLFLTIDPFSSYTHAYTRTHTHARIHTHARTRTHTHARACARTHTRTHAWRHRA